MQTLRTALVAVTLMGLTGFASAAEINTGGYDPVARAIALGLTPEAVDAAFDRAIAAAEQCDAAALALQSIGCSAPDVANIDSPALPPLES